MLKRNLIIGTLVLLIAGNSKDIFAANTTDTYKDKLNSTNSNIKETENKLNSIKEQHSNIKSKASEIETKINIVQSEIDIENTKLNQLEIEYKQKQDELELLKKEFEQNYKLFEKQLISSYTQSFDDSYAKVLFKANTLSDFIIGNTYFKYILDDKDIQLTSLDENMEKQTLLLEEIEKNKEESEKIKLDLDKKRASLESKQTSYQNELQKLQSDSNELEVILDAQNKEAIQLESKIQDLQRELYNTSNDISQSTSNTNTTNNNTTDSSAESKPSSSNGFTWPTNSKRVTSKYGYRIHPVTGVKKMHTGIDIGEGMGAGIYASNSGTVIYADWRGGYGKTVIIDHGDYISTLYAHMNSINVSKGQSVSKGQKIGTMGSTGMSTGPHLHFEVRKNGQHQNPMNYIK